MAETLLTSVGADEKLLLLNHLEFLRTHRGKIYRREEAWCVESDRGEYTFAIPESVSSVRGLVSRYATFNLKPDCLKFETELQAMGFCEDGALNYLFLKTEDAGWKVNDLVGVKRVLDSKDMEMFSEVQARGFCDSNEEYNEWHPWLHQANLKNQFNASQVFYIAHLSDEPVAVAMAIFHKPLTGIYAVTTLPAFRKQGISTTLLNEIAKDSSAKGIEMLTLQVSHGSYAEFFYQRLGFKSSFLVKIMSREKL